MGQRGGLAGQCGEKAHNAIYDRLRSACPHGTPGCRRRMERRQADRLDRHPATIHESTDNFANRFGSVESKFGSLSPTREVGSEVNTRARQPLRRHGFPEQRANLCICAGPVKRSSPGRISVPAGLIEVSAAMDRSGELVGWDFANYNSGGSAIEVPYTIPHGRTQFLDTAAPLRQGSYRALASTANVFARESAMDELAMLARLDPLEFRLRHLQPGRLRDVLTAAARQFGWEKRPALKSGRGIGIACGTEKGSYTAVCAEVEVRDQEVRVIRACQAFECGAIHNPANLRRQVEGCLVMGMGAALHEAIQFRDGRITNPSFAEYRVPRMRDLPKLDILLLDRPDLPSVGGSETPIIGIAPAIANAVHDATGQRCRSMPIQLS